MNGGEFKVIKVPGLLHGDVLFQHGQSASVGRIRRFRRHPALAPHDCRMATLPHLIRPTGAQLRTY
ncbi:hypothetical protein STM474_0083 [Salmonella enterica subsp. enterica serovar Typhimurium str. ST4/74]|uniref:Uncharacterized protein n=1 Tax=Salmonella typhimurium (strain 4/74) TaxID=909946 RepID=E8XGY8_SALT4|nr:hypothetical protein STM474_0083 [Salmonella enterica subsp. enterica serovar Typhimurium str. ST4/74]